MTEFINERNHSLSVHSLYLFLPKSASKSRRKLVSSFSGGRVLRKERHKAQNCSLYVLLPSSDGASGSELMVFPSASSVPADSLPQPLVQFSVTL